MVALPLARGDRARDRLDPRRARGHDRRLPRADPGRAGERNRASPRPIALAQSIYVAGACIGALFFGQLTDRFGRKKLFLITLASTSWRRWRPRSRIDAVWFLAARFFTGAGIGGEYSAINSAIDELIPARARGRVDLIINGSFWVGAAVGGLASDRPAQGVAASRSTSAGGSPSAIGATLGLGILFIRRNVPESPRWLFIHGREEEAERSSTRSRSEVVEEHRPGARGAGRVDQGAPAPPIPFREIARTVVQDLPEARGARALAVRRPGVHLQRGHGHARDHADHLLRRRREQGRTLLCGIRGRQLHRAAAPRAALRHRRPQADDRRHLPDLGSDARWRGRPVRAASNGKGVQRLGGSPWRSPATFFFASAGASSAYLTVSEVFPMEIRALAIAFFYAIGTAIGGITGPLVFEKLGESGDMGRRDDRAT